MLISTWLHHGRVFKLFVAQDLVPTPYIEVAKETAETFWDEPVGVRRNDSMAVAEELFVFSKSKSAALVSRWLRSHYAKEKAESGACCMKFPSLPSLAPAAVQAARAAGRACWGVGARC